MRGRANFVAVFTWPVVGRAVRQINPSAITAALVLEISRFRITHLFDLFAKRLFSVRAVKQFFDKLHTLEI
jgi:hypothetical protein